LESRQSPKISADDHLRYSGLYDCSKTEKFIYDDAYCFAYMGVIVHLTRLTRLSANMLQMSHQDGLAAAIKTLASKVNTEIP